MERIGKRRPRSTNSISLLMEKLDRIQGYSKYKKVIRMYLIKPLPVYRRFAVQQIAGFRTFFSHAARPTPFKNAKQSNTVNIHDETGCDTTKHQFTARDQYGTAKLHTMYNVKIS